MISTAGTGCPSDYRMIVADTSALMALLLNEPEADRIEDALEIAISGGTLVEALIVAHRRGIGDEMARLLSDLSMTVVPITQATAQRIADAYDVWGKGRHPAGLKFGDCFAYALAAERGAPLLHVGDDFARTDLVPT